MYIDFITTPLGTLEIKASHVGVSSVIFSALTHDAQPCVPSKITDNCKQQLGEYFLGQRNKFDLPLDQQGTNFQKSVWACLLKVPFGQAASYQDIATMLENPKAVRAVGAANGKNPISIIVPCHRIIGSNARLTGYAGGLERKTWLLEHEGINFKREADHT
ncbi:MAG: methylated-DNA-[protein]-cysteine S-methyltransferase [Kiritimatiellia bacterium]|jgi:methylated-DNA-[protein]-cysteine S-methyltransferase